MGISNDYIRFKIVRYAVTVGSNSGRACFKKDDAKGGISD